MQITPAEIAETLAMVSKQHLDIRTITLGLNLRGCTDSDIDVMARKVYDRMTTAAEQPRAHGRAAGARVRHPHRQQAHLRHAHRPGRPPPPRRDRPHAPSPRPWTAAAKTTGVNFIGGFSALVHEGHDRGGPTSSSASIPAGAVRHRQLVCSSVNVGSTKAGIDMDAVALDGPASSRTLAEPHRRPGRLRLRQAGGVLQRGGGQPLHGRRLPRRRARPDDGHQRGRLRPRRGVPRPPGREGAALRRGGRDHQEDRLPDHPHGPAGGPGGQPRGWTRPSASWTCPSRRRPPSGDSVAAHPGGDGPGGRAAPTAPPRPWPCSTTR